MQLLRCVAPVAVALGWFCCYVAVAVAWRADKRAEKGGGGVREIVAVLENFV